MPRVMLFVLLFVVLLILAYVMFCLPPAELPIYALSTPDVTRTNVLALATHAGATVVDTTDRFIVRDGPRRIEVYKLSGGIWLEDTTAHWKPEARPMLPADTTLRALAPAWVQSGRQLAKTSAFDSAVTRFDFSRYGGSYVRGHNRSTGASLATQTLDRQLIYTATVRTGRAGLRRLEYPVAGGGGRFKVSFGDHGSMVAFSGVWRSVDSVKSMAKVVSIKSALAEFGQITNHMATPISPPVIVYYSAPAPQKQRVLYPVYLIRSRGMVDGVLSNLPVVMIPATTYSSQILANTAPTPPARTETDSPAAGWDDPEPDTHYEAGASWMLKKAGLTNTQSDATGFLDALSDAGWTTNFNWGDADAWDRDWKSKRSEWADAVDIAFFSGHANPHGWSLWSKANRSGTVSSENLTSGMWGGKDLEWLVIDGCGPLQDDSITSGDGDAIDRWQNAFGGLHILFGFASESEDTPEEGRRFAEIALGGEELVSAWFRATSEAQGPHIDRSNPNDRVVAAVMYAYQDGVAESKRPSHDHLWGAGFVANDPVNPDWLELMWTDL